MHFSSILQQMIQFLQFCVEFVETSSYLQCVLVYIAMFVHLNHKGIMMNMRLCDHRIRKWRVEGYTIASLTEEVCNSFDCLVRGLGLIFVIADTDIYILILVRIGA